MIPVSTRKDKASSGESGESMAVQASAALEPRALGFSLTCTPVWSWVKNRSGSFPAFRIQLGERWIPPQAEGFVFLLLWNWCSEELKHSPVHPGFSTLHAWALPCSWTVGTAVETRGIPQLPCFLTDRNLWPDLVLGKLGFGFLIGSNEDW